MKNIPMPKVGLADVLRAFWRGIKPQQWALYATIVLFVTMNVLNLLVPVLYKRFFDTITRSSPSRVILAPHLVHILLQVLVVHAAAWVLARVGFFILNNFEAQVMARLRQISFDHLTGHSYSFFSNNFSGALVQRLNRFSRSFERLYDTLVFNVLPLLVNIIGVIIVVWRQQPRIAMIILGWALVTMTVNYFFSRWKVKYDLQSAAADSATTARLSDAIANHAAVSSFAAGITNPIHSRMSPNTRQQPSGYPGICRLRSTRCRRVWSLSPSSSSSTMP